jgi:hypothetical protein
MVSHIEQRVLSLVSRWPTPDANAHERFAHNCTSHTCNGLGYLFVENPANFEIQYNMRALIRILASENCRIQLLEDPLEDDIYSGNVMTVSDFRVRHPMLAWIAHSHRPHGVLFNHARPIPHARSRVEAVVFLKIVSRGIHVHARRLTMQSETVLMSHMIGPHIPRRYWVVLYNHLFDQRYGLASVCSGQNPIRLNFDVLLTPTGDYRPLLNDTAFWPFLLPLIAQEQMHSSAPVLDYVQQPTETEQEAIRRVTPDHVFCVFRHVGHNSLLIVASEPGTPAHLASGRRAIRHIPLPPPPTAAGSYRMRLRVPMDSNR